MPQVRVNDVTLYYEMDGTGAETVLFLHGLGSSVRDWEPQMVAFAERYQVVGVDIRGHGRSDKPRQKYSVPMFADDVAQFIRQLGVGAVHVVGLSMGGMIAFQLAVDAPELLKSMTIVNSGPALVPRTFKERLQIWQRLIITWLFDMRRIGEFVGGRLFPKPEQADMRQMFADRWAENDKKAYLAATRALVGWSVIEHLPQMNVPTLVVTADQDYTPVSVKEAYVAQMPQAELVVIEDSHHATPTDQAEAFNTAVMDFLGRR